MALVEINSNFIKEIGSLHVFILTIFIVWVILLFFSLKKYGIKKTIRYFLPIVIVTLIIELIGVANSGYYYPGYLFYISAMGNNVPLIIILGWSANLFLLLHMGKSVVIRLYNKDNFLRILLISICAGVFGVCMDLIEDPLAHHESWWIWNETQQRATLFDVPLTNFAGWFIIIGGITLLTLLIERSQYTENMKVLISISSSTIVLIPLGFYFLFQ